MKKQLINTILLTLLLTLFGQVASAQNRPPVFLKFVKNGVIMDKDNLEVEMKEGEVDTIQIYAQDPDGDVAHIVASGLQSGWCYFMSPSGASSATLVLAPDDAAEGYYNFSFNTFDNDASLAGPSVLMAVHIIDRNALGTNDTKVTISNYPNPFKTTTTLEYVVPRSGKASLKIYTTTGREVMSIINNATASPYRYFTKIDMSNFPSGTYVYRLNVDGVGEASGRMIKL